MQSQLIRHLLTVDPRYRATIYDVAHHPWVFGEDADEILAMELASSIGDGTLDSNKDRDSTESSDTESDNKPAPIAVTPRSILKGNSADEESTVIAEQAAVGPNPALESDSVDSACKLSNDDIPSVHPHGHISGLPQHKGVIQNETDSFLSLASSTATLPSESSSAISNNGDFGNLDMNPAIRDVVKRRTDGSKQLRIQRPATVGAMCSDLPSPRTLIKQLTGEDTIFESSTEDKRTSVRLSKRISCGKYSKITELWESIFNETQVQAILMAQSSSPKSESGSGGAEESSGSSSSEDLLDILNTKHLKKSYSSSFKLTCHRVSSHRRSMRTHREMAIMEAQQQHQFWSESLLTKREFRKGTRDSGLGDDLEHLAKVYHKALEISSTLD